MVQFCFSRSYLGIETVSCHLLSRMARINMDWNLKKLSHLMLLPHEPGFFLNRRLFYTNQPSVHTKSVNPD